MRLKSLLAVIMLGCAMASPALAWTQFGFNFRESAGFVTDGANEAYSGINGGSQLDQYPTTRNGATFGWTANTGDVTRDRNAAFDRRLAGMNQRHNSTGTPITWRVDLPSTGSYKICLASGQAYYASAYVRIEILDNTTSKFVMLDTDGIPADTFNDANGTNHTAANWATNNTCKTGVTFATTTLFMKLGATSVQSGDSVIAHLYVEKETAAAPTRSGLNTGINLNLNGGIN